MHRITPITAMLLLLTLGAAFAAPTSGDLRGNPALQSAVSSTLLTDQFCADLEAESRCHIPGTPFDGGGNGHCRVESSYEESPVLVCHPDLYFDYDRRISPPPIYSHRKEVCEQQLKHVQRAATTFTPEELSQLRWEGKITAQEQATLEHAQRPLTLADVCPEFADTTPPSDRYCHGQAEGDSCTVTGTIGVQSASFSGMCKTQAVTHRYYHEGEHRLVREALVCTPPNPVVHRFDKPSRTSTQSAVSTPGLLDCTRTDLTEQQLLQQAPHGARHKDKNTLVLHWTKGTHAFSNQRPSESGRTSVEYFYCGYDKANRVHLVLEESPALQTGIVLKDDDGTLLPGVITVLFSPDGSKYLTIRQPDGLDGEEWAVYTKNGQKTWEGISRITADDGQTFVAERTYPSWDGNGWLHSSVRCSDTTAAGPKDRTSDSILEYRDGRYHWRPEHNCTVSE